MKAVCTIFSDGPLAEKFSSPFEIIIWYCSECRRAFVWACIEDTAHWSNVTAPTEGPQFCPCCGGFHCLMKAQGKDGKKDAKDAKTAKASS